MAKIGVMTFLHNDNYGSSLQAYALQRVLTELGHRCEHIDYRPGRGEKARNLIASGNQWKLVLQGLRKKRVRVSRSGAMRKSRAIPDFYRRRMKLSPVCGNRSALRKQSERYDLLLAGSDQIWNPTWLNPAYFLQFAPDGKRKAAYAASLGVSVLSAPRKREKIRRWTADFTAISVREEAGAALMKEITGKRPAVMPDPVCLLSGEEWAELASGAPTEAPYLLCYFIGENPARWERVRTLSAERSLRVYVLPVTEESYRQGFELLDGIPPEAFLGAIRGAALVCTDSFHCLAFSALFGVPHEVFRRDREGDPESGYSRIEQFLRSWTEEGPERLRERGRRWLRENLGT